MKHGYAGIVTDGKKEKYFEFIKIKQKVHERKHHHLSNLHFSKHQL